MAKRVEKFRTFEDERRATSLWLVCRDAAIPVGSRELGEKVAAEMPCSEHHEVITLDLRPINWRPLADHHARHAFAHSANSVTVGVLEPRCEGVLSRDAGRLFQNDAAADIPTADALLATMAEKAITLTERRAAMV